MQYVTDFHLHSKYSRAVSPNMTLPFILQHAVQKGLDILTATDWTHPAWFREICSQLEEVEEGMYSLKKEFNSENITRPIRFLLSTEIACIYKQDNKVRRIHNLVFVPNLETAEKVTEVLIRRGANLRADGRPIIGLSSKVLLELLLAIDERCFLIPCHVWTPHFGVYGSASGFASLSEAFGDLEKYIYGIETGISSDPEMNWRIAELRDRSILSFSDAHSAPRMGREATVFHLEKPTYEHIRQAIRRKSKANKVAYTIEFYPEEGKYHFSGHRSCVVMFTPEQTLQQSDICPVCRKKLTEGVFVRVNELGAVDNKLTLEKVDERGVRWITDASNEHPPFIKLVPLLEICAETLGMSTNSKKVLALFSRVCVELGNELQVLIHASLDDIARVGGEKLAEGVRKVRKGEISIQPGYDGVYGKVSIWPDKKLSTPQLSWDF